MAILNINPTRMELLQLKKKIVQSKRGHKLLKNKQDGLMSKFMKIINDIKDLRLEIEQKIMKAYKNFKIASASMDSKALENILLFSSFKLSLDIELKNVMSVKIPDFKFKSEGDPFAYGFLNSSADMDLSVKLSQEVVGLMIKLANTEKQAERLAVEIEKTTRRVNALEYKIIPDQEETAKFIRMKLDESERSSIITTMKIKSMIEE